MPDAETQIIKEVSQSEVADMMTAIGLTSYAADSVFLAYATDEINAAMLVANDALYHSVLGSLQAAPSKEAIAEALALAARDAATLAKGIAEAEMNKIGQVIANNIANGGNPKEAARLLDMVKGLDSNRASAYLKYAEELEQSGLSDAEIAKRLETRYKKLLRERKKTIAHNEQRIAEGNGNETRAKDAGKKWKLWQSAGDDRVSDECLSNESAGWIPIKESFPGGASHEPQHIGCRCVVSYRVNEPDAAAKDRAEKTAKRTEVAKDKAKEK